MSDGPLVLEARRVVPARVAPTVHWVSSAVSLALAVPCAIAINTPLVLAAPLLLLLTGALLIWFPRIAIVETIRFDSERLVRVLRVAGLWRVRVIETHEIAAIGRDHRGRVVLVDHFGDRVAVIGRFADDATRRRIASTLRDHHRRSPPTSVWTHTTASEIF